jgi:hypothetical protein
VAFCPFCGFEAKSKPDITDDLDNKIDPSTQAKR